MSRATLSSFRPDFVAAITKPPQKAVEYRRRADATPSPGLASALLCPGRSKLSIWEICRKECFTEVSPPSIRGRAILSSVFAGRAQKSPYFCGCAVRMRQGGAVAPVTRRATAAAAVSHGVFRKTNIYFLFRCSAQRKGLQHGEIEEGYLPERFTLRAEKGVFS